MSLPMCTFAAVACAGPMGDASALPWQAQSPAKNDSCDSSDGGDGGPPGAWARAGRAARAAKIMAAPARNTRCCEDVLDISSPPWNPLGWVGQRVLRTNHTRRIDPHPIFVFEEEERPALRAALP